MTLKRRDFLKVAGVGGLALLSGAGARAVQAGVFNAAEGPAYLPWETWQQLEAPLPLVGAAILASNAHNTQPWLFTVSPDTIEVYRDPTRTIGTIDPFLREQVMSLGCAIGNLTVAAQGHGYMPEVILLPDPSAPDLMARIRLQGGTAQTGELYNAISRRHTDRAAYDTTRPIEEVRLAQLTAHAEAFDNVHLTWTSQAAEKEALGQRIIQATQDIIADEQQAADSYAWFQNTRRDLMENRHGPTLDAAGLPPVTTGLIKMLPPPTKAQNEAGWLAGTAERQVPTAAAWGTLSIRDAGDDRQRLQAGIVWQLMHLSGTVLGLGMQPINQIVERIDRDKQLKRPPAYDLNTLLGIAVEWEPIFQFRLGYPTREALPSPRRPISEVVMESAR